MLTVRETATTLAALRHWQQALDKHGNSFASSWPQFADVLPLSLAEIDGLCEWLNMREPCGCEQPGHFASGIPGILARIENGRVAAGTEVQRCDECQRFASDPEALARLVELGLA